MESASDHTVRIDMPCGRLPVFASYGSMAACSRDSDALLTEHVDSYDQSFHGETHHRSVDFDYQGHQSRHHASRILRYPFP